MMGIHVYDHILLHDFEFTAGRVVIVVIESFQTRTVTVLLSSRCCTEVVRTRVVTQLLLALAYCERVVPNRGDNYAVLTLKSSGPVTMFFDA